MGMSGNSNKSNRTALSEINVTPLVDVMLVLLIIFMVTSPMMSQGIDVNLPETASSGIETNEDPFLIVIKKNRKIFIGETQIQLSSMSNKLKAILENRKNKQVYIQADKAVDYGLVAETMAEIRAAGVFNIGLVTLPKAL